MTKRAAADRRSVVRVYLTGFMGAGKSAAGHGLAAALGWQFVDLDRAVEERVGMPIPDLFERRGEAGFRALERAELEATLGRDRLVVATGGGALAQPGALELLRGRGLIVFLDLPFAELARRVEAAGAGARPLYGDLRSARRLFRDRLPFYRQADLVLAVEGGEPVEEVVRRLLVELEVEACVT